MVRAVIFSRIRFFMARRHGVRRLEVCGKRCDRRMRAWEGGRFSSLDRRYALERGSHTSLISLLSRSSLSTTGIQL